MTSSPRILFLSSLALLLFVTPLQGQLLEFGRLSVEPRMGVAFPKGDFGDVDPTCPLNATGCPYPTQIGTEAGWRWEARLHVALTDRWAAVAGYGQTQLGCSKTFCGLGPEPKLRTVSMGLQGRLFPLGSMEVWAEGGGTYEEFSVIRTRSPAGDEVSEAVWYPWSAGFYGGMGAELALTGEENLFFTPGFSVRYTPADPPDSDPDLRSVSPLYIVAEMGFKVLLGR